jgi:serine kinase of HPr protein (carbohydrate metabolism regulator)
MTTGADQTGTYVHATVVVVGEAGVLIRGASGSGKSALALALLAAAEQRGLFARLVGDDRVSLLPTGDRLLARAHPAIAGLIEERGTGLLPVPYETAAIIRCVVDLAGESTTGQTARLPEVEQKTALVDSIRLPRLALDSRASAQEGARRILSLLRP